MLAKVSVRNKKNMILNYVWQKKINCYSSNNADLNLCKSILNVLRHKVAETRISDEASVFSNS